MAKLPDLEGLALFPTITLRAFENGYWYLEQLKNFAERIGIPAAKKLRRDELEKTFVAFLRASKAALPTKRSLRKTGVKDVERGLLAAARSMCDSAPTTIAVSTMLRSEHMFRRLVWTKTIKSHLVPERFS